jgi:hypothetical protein
VGVIKRFKIILLIMSNLNKEIVQNNKEKKQNLSEIRNTYKIKEENIRKMNEFLNKQNGK